MAKGQVGGGLLALGMIIKFLYDNAILALILVGATTLVPFINLFMWIADDKGLVGVGMDFIIALAFAAVGFFVYKRFTETIRRTAEIVGIGILGVLYICTPWLATFSKDALILWWFAWVVSSAVVCIIDWYNDQYVTSESNKPAATHSLAAFGLGSQQGQTKSYKTYVTNKLAILSGHTADSIKANSEKIANELGVNKERLQITRGSDPATVNLKITNEEPWQTPVIWEGPTNVGANIAAPILFGTYADGSDADVYIAGKEGKSCQNFLIAGMSGSGKSTTAQILLASALARSEVSVLLADPLKGYATSGLFMDGIEWFADGVQALYKMKDAVERSVKPRMDYLQDHGYSHWVPGCGLNLIVFLIEEFSGAEGGNDNSKAWAKMLNSVRAAGIVVIPSLQRTTTKTLAGDIKAQLAGHFIHGLKSAVDTRVAMGESAIETPHEWKDAYPGRHYFESKYTEAEYRGQVVQSYYFDPKPSTMPKVAAWQVEQYETIKDMLAWRHEYATPLDEVTRQAFGADYEKYRASRETSLEITTEIEIVEEINVPQFSQKRNFNPAEKQQELMWNATRGMQEVSIDDILTAYSSLGGTMGKTTVNKWIEAEVRAKRVRLGKRSGSRGSSTKLHTFYDIPQSNLRDGYDILDVEYAEED